MCASSRARVPIRRRFRSSSRTARRSARMRSPRCGRGPVRRTGVDVRSWVLRARRGVLRAASTVHLRGASRGCGSSRSVFAVRVAIPGLPEGRRVLAEVVKRCGLALVLCLGCEGGRARGFELDHGQREFDDRRARRGVRGRGGAALSGRRSRRARVRVRSLGVPAVRFGVPQGGRLLARVPHHGGRGRLPVHTLGPAVWLRLTRDVLAAREEVRSTAPPPAERALYTYHPSR